VTPGEVRVALLADRPELVAGLAKPRWREWGPEPERPELADWVAVTRREAGRGPGLPVTFVASGGRAVAFYQRCGMRLEGTARSADGGEATVLVKPL
jgi:RimJ/RimL family protein N-acetyltransferase